MRRIFVGDIQGCAEELKRLLAAVAFEPGGDRLYSVGDVINRGPDSAEAVRVLRAAGAIAVIGNHEKHLLDDPSRTLPDDLATAADREELTAWLAALPVMHVEPDLILVHAAYSPAWQQEAPEQVAARLNALHRRGVRLRDDAELRFAVTARYCMADGLLLTDWRAAAPPFQPWTDFYRLDRWVVFGHWAMRGLVRERRIRGLDTGCVYGGELTGWIAEEDRIMQVPALGSYCAKE